jgi:hypothetical protein
MLRVRVAVDGDRDVRAVEYVSVDHQAANRRLHRHGLLGQLDALPVLDQLLDVILEGCLTAGWQAAMRFATAPASSVVGVWT